MIELGSRPGIAVARSASSRMIAADFPPSSRVRRLSCAPHSAAIRFPAAVEPVKLILSTSRCVTRCSPTLAARRHDVDHTRRQPDLFEHVGEQVRVEWRLGRGLQHDGGTGRQRGSHLQHDREERDVPRHDATCDTDRLAAHQHRAERALPELFELVLACEVRVVVEHHRRGEHLAHDREGDRRTHLLADRAGDVFVARLDELGDLLHHVGALAGSHARPRPGVEGATRCGHRAVDVLVRCFGNGRDDLFGER